MKKIRNIKFCAVPALHKKSATENVGATMVEYVIVLLAMIAFILALSQGMLTGASTHYSRKAPGFDKSYPQGFVRNPTPTP